MLVNYSLTDQNPVIDKTGITGSFDIPLPSIRDLRGAVSTTTEAAAPGVVNDSPTFDGMRDVLEKFGLVLERSKGASQLLVIDHVARPSEN